MLEWPHLVANRRRLGFALGNQLAGEEVFAGHESEYLPYRLAFQRWASKTSASN